MERGQRGASDRSPQVKGSFSLPPPPPRHACTHPLRRTRGRLAALAACPSSSSSSSSLIARRGQAELPQDCPLCGHHPQARPCPHPARGKTGQEGGTRTSSPTGCRICPHWLAALLKGLTPVSPLLLLSIHAAPGGVPPGPPMAAASRGELVPLRGILLGTAW